MNDTEKLADRLFDPTIQLVIDVNETAIGQARMLESMEQTERDTGHLAAAAAQLAGSAKSLRRTTDLAATASSVARDQVTASPPTRSATPRPSARAWRRSTRW